MNQRAVDMPPVPWIRRFRAKGPVKLRLFCFPSAGAGASLFSTWPNELPASVEVCALQLPGREDRINERFLNRLVLVLQHVAESLDPFLDKPFVFYGHSMGALVAFELARLLRRVARLSPRHLFCSSCRAPQDLGKWNSFYDLPEPHFLEKISHFGGIPEPLRQEPEMMRLFLRVLRADFEIFQTYQYYEEPPFNFSITAYGGSQDTQVPPGALDGWHCHTTAAFERLEFSGSHFFIHSARAIFLDTLSEALQRLGSVKK